LTAGTVLPDAGLLFGTSASARRRRAVLLLLVPSLVLVGTLAYDFVFDDSLVILQDPALTGASDLRDLFSQRVRVMDVTLGYYRPVIGLVYRLDWLLWGDNPAGYRLTNLLWHLVATVLVYRIALRTGNGIVAAWLAAMIFGILPAHTESIGWIQGRVDIVPTVLGLLAHLAWLRGRQRRGSRAWGCAALCGLALLGALLAKEVAAALPFAWGVWEASALAGLARAERRRRATALVPGTCAVLAAVLTYAVLRGLAVGAVVAFPMQTSPVGLRALAVLIMLAEYVRGLALPGPTLHFYRPLRVAVTPAMLTLAVATLVLLGGGLMVAWRRARPLFPWIAWLPVTLLPALLFVLYAPAAESGFYTAERFLYLPSVGWCVLVGCAGAWLWESAHTAARRRVAGIGLLVVLLGCTALTLVRLQPWADPEDFYLAMRAQPGLPREMRVFIHNDLGRVYLERGLSAAAQEEFLRALRLKPDYGLAHNNMGVALIRDGKPREARAWLEAAIRLDPTHSEAYGNLGVVHEATGDRMAARRAYEAGLRVAPGSAWLVQKLARVNAAIQPPPAPLPEVAP
jgi:tetratricopeptide (TPR) repeat protein